MLQHSYLAKNRNPNAFLVVGNSSQPFQSHLACSKPADANAVCAHCERAMFHGVLKRAGESTRCDLSDTLLPQSIICWSDYSVLSTLSRILLTPPAWGFSPDTGTRKQIAPSHSSMFATVKDITGTLCGHFLILEKS